MDLEILVPVNLGFGGLWLVRSIILATTCRGGQHRSHPKPHHIMPLDGLFVTIAGEFLAWLLITSPLFSGMLNRLPMDLEDLMRTLMCGQLRHLGDP